MKKKINFQVAFFLLTLFAGIFMILPFLNFIPMLATGDHGRDFYAYAQTLHGATPYRDYWWVYGPLMPYYYALWMKFLGVSMASVLIGKFFLAILTTLVVFATLALFFPSYLACVGALWFLAFNPDFFFTYNHLGGIFITMLAFYSLTRFIISDIKAWALGALSCLFILCLIKINFGLANLIGFLFILTINKRVQMSAVPLRQLFGFSAFILLITTAFYSLISAPLTVTELRQCFPYLKGDEPYNTSSTLITILANIQNLVTSIINQIFLNPISMVLSAGVIFSIIFLITEWIQKRISTRLILMLFSLGILFIVNLNEYFLSGVQYRVYWSKPFSILSVFFLLFAACKRLPRWVGICLAMGIAGFLLVDGQTKYAIMQQVKTPDRFLSDANAQVYLGNAPAFIETVRQTTDFINKKIPLNENIFVLPYDPLYYYLTNHKSPTRQIIFFDHIHISEKQELQVIDDLETKHVTWVVFSNRVASNEQGLGVFGQTYCPTLAKYISDNFVPAAHFGDWTNPPGWAWNHGMKIWKKKIN